MRYLTLAGIAATGLFFAGCSKSVSSSNVEKDIASKFGARGYGTASCPKDLDAKVGATETCTVKGKSGSAHVKVTVSRVSGSTAYYTLELRK